jgi:HAD superfamily hydrolase (TIGR01509 family)
MNWTLPEGTEALIFDCDGTLADTMPLHFAAWSSILAPLGISFSETRFYQLGGMPTGRIIRILSEESGVPILDVDDLTHRKETAFLAELHRVEPVPAVYRIAESYRGQLPIAVASGGYRSVVQQTLETIGVADWIQALVCAEDTPRHKPEPDAYLEAARRLGITPEKCVAFEDTDIGLESIRRAGMIGYDVRPWYNKK